MLEYIERLEIGQGLVTGVICSDYQKSVCVLLSEDFPDNALRIAALKQTASHYQIFFSPKNIKPQASYLELKAEESAASVVHSAVENPNIEKLIIECKNSIQYSEALEIIGFTKRDLITQAQMQETPAFQQKSKGVFGRAHHLMDQIYRNAFWLDNLWLSEQNLSITDPLISSKAYQLQKNIEKFIPSSVKYFIDMDKAPDGPQVMQLSNMFAPYAQTLIEIDYQGFNRIYLLEREENDPYKTKLLIWSKYHGQKDYVLCPLAANISFSSEGLRIQGEEIFEMSPPLIVAGLTSENLKPHVNSVLYALSVINSPRNTLGQIEQPKKRNTSFTTSLQPKRAPFYIYNVHELAKPLRQEDLVIHESPAGYYERNSPALHLREAHLRRKPYSPVGSLKEVFVREAVVGNAARGAIAKAYISPEPG